MSWVLMACPTCGHPAIHDTARWAKLPYWRNGCAHIGNPVRMTMEEAHVLWMWRRGHIDRTYIATCTGEPIVNKISD